jgi:hypothetical protein
MELYNITDSANIAFTQFKAPPPVKSLRFTDMSIEAYYGDIEFFGIFPAGIEREDAVKGKGIIAELGDVEYDYESNYTRILTLIDSETDELWTGSGTFDIFIFIPDGINGLMYWEIKDVVFAPDAEVVSMEYYVESNWEWFLRDELDLGDPIKVTITGLPNAEEVNFGIMNTYGSPSAFGEASISSGTAVLELFTDTDVPWSETGNYYLQLAISNDSYYFTNGGKLLFAPQSIEDAAASGLKLFSLKAENTIEFAKFARVPQPNCLTIQNISAEFSNLAQDGAYIGIFPRGTTLAQAKAGTNLVAEAVSNNINNEGDSLDAELYTSSNVPWEVTGTYDVFLFLGSGSAIQYYRAQSIAMENGSTLYANYFERTDE